MSTNLTQSETAHVAKKGHQSAIRIGIQPTGWTNDDFPEIGNSTPYQQILDETAQASFEGGSTGHNYPTHLPSLRYELGSRKLGITSTWVGTKFTAANQYEQTIEFVRGQIAFLKAVEATDIVVAELASAVNQIRDKSVLDDRPIFNEPQWYLLTRGLNEAGKLALENGIRLSYHHHVGTGVQSRAEVERLLANTDPRYVLLCLDTGHLFFAGDDPASLARDHGKRIGHVHLKDVRKKILEKAVPGKFSFYQAIMEGIFTVPGDPEGSIDFGPIFKSFRDNNYEGWIVVEAEQDPVKAPPLQYAQMARDFIRKNFGG
jgi:inosose dehydratase